MEGAALVFPLILIILSIRISAFVTILMGLKGGSFLYNRWYKILFEHLAGTASIFAATKKPSTLILG